MNKDNNKIIKFLNWFLHSYIWLFIIFLGLDIATKLLVRNNMTVNHSYSVIPGFLEICYTINNAAAFSIGTGNDVANRIIYICVASIASIGIMVYYTLKQNKLHPIIKACLMLIIVGALGNCIDRIFYGPKYGVVDWINFVFWPEVWHFPFNIADSCVVVAAFILIVYFIIGEINDYKARKALEVSQENKDIKDNNSSTNGRILSKSEQEKIEQKNNK